MTYEQLQAANEIKNRIVMLENLIDVLKNDQCFFDIYDCPGGLSQRFYKGHEKDSYHFSALRASFKAELRLLKDEFDKL